MTNAEVIAKATKRNQIINGTVVKNGEVLYVETITHGELRADWFLADVIHRYPENRECLNNLGDLLEEFKQIHKL